MIINDNRTSEFFDSYAIEFDAIYGTKNTLSNRLINKMFRKSMRLRYEKTLLGCSPIEGNRVIDVGCGPGHYSLALAKAGASYVLGIDFAKSMVDISIDRAKKFEVSNRCRFEVADFIEMQITETFDYAVVMGFMDYIQQPTKLIDKVLKITQKKAFFSFPKNDGFLAWLRKLRYSSRCDLFLYNLEMIHTIFKNLKIKHFEYETIDRDYFVSVHL